jgi:hypothetical protein
MKTGEYGEKELGGCIAPDYLTDTIAEVLDIVL